MNRPSRGARESVTTTRYEGCLVLPTRVRRILTATAGPLLVIVVPEVPGVPSRRPPRGGDGPAVRAGAQNRCGSPGIVGAPGRPPLPLRLPPGPANERIIDCTVLNSLSSL